jgi:hypothetical protein
MFTAKTTAAHHAPIPRKKRKKLGRISSVTKQNIPNRNQINTGETSMILAP